jgi:hemolysin III
MTYDKYPLNRYTLKEEIFNSITHGVGALFSLIAMIILVAYGGMQRDIWRIVSFSIYGFTMFFLYLSSTLYHSIFHEKTKRIFRILDHAAIFLLIAGSYTPIVLIPMRGALGWTIFGLVWSLALIGIVLKIFSFEKTKYISLILYVAMGWVIVLAAKPMLSVIPKELFFWILVGGLFYTLGLIFYLVKKIPYNHGIWHLFVLGGSIIHFLGFLFHLAI